MRLSGEVKTLLQWKSAIKSTGIVQKVDVHISASLTSDRVIIIVQCSTYIGCECVYICVVCVCAYDRYHVLPLLPSLSLSLPLPLSLSLSPAPSPSPFPSLTPSLLWGGSNYSLLCTQHGGFHAGV